MLINLNLISPWLSIEVRWIQIVRSKMTWRNDWIAVWIFLVIFILLLAFFWRFWNWLESFDVRGKIWWNDRGKLEAFCRIFWRILFSLKLTFFILLFILDSGFVFLEDVLFNYLALLVHEASVAAFAVDLIKSPTVAWLRLK